MADDKTNNTWEYDRGGDDQDRRKHLWGEDSAGFVIKKGAMIGKCPCSLTRDEAKLENLLHEAIPSERQRLGSPLALYNVYRGVVYIARQTVPGRSYHGFPWSGRNGQRIETEIKERLKARATREGFLTEYEKWMKVHEGE